MLFSNELNYWVIKKKCEKIFTALIGGAISELVLKPEKRNRFQKFVIKRKRRSSHGYGSLIIYGLSNRFYCSCTLVGVLTIPRFWDKF
ncbi:hypothetical protein DPV73_02315 [Leptospira mayottensis]|nr:hypothetical protein DPV73_02315 [Leptospira mayottensis]